MPSPEVHVWRLVQYFCNHEHLHTRVICATSSNTSSVPHSSSLHLSPTPHLATKYTSIDKSISRWLSLHLSSDVMRAYLTDTYSCNVCRRGHSSGDDDVSDCTIESTLNVQKTNVLVIATAIVVEITYSCIYSLVLLYMFLFRHHFKFKVAVFSQITASFFTLHLPSACFLSCQPTILCSWMLPTSAKRHSVWRQIILPQPFNICRVWLSPHSTANTNMLCISFSPLYSHWL